MFGGTPRDSLGGQQHAAAGGQLVGVAAPHQELCGRPRRELRLTHVAEVPRQVDRLAWTPERPESN